MRVIPWVSASCCVSFLAAWAAAEPPALTTLSNRSLTYRVPENPYAILKRAQIEAVVVDNRAVNDAVLPGHRAGYNGIASLKHARFSQSPSGGGTGNPAWDFQCLIPGYEVGKRYQLVMRAMYLPYESPGQIEKVSIPHRQALE
jgi:hypothetical protein